MSFGPKNPSMSLDFDSSPPPKKAPDNLDQEESQLWRWALWFMIFLAAALAALLRERLENIPF